MIDRLKGTGKEGEDGGKVHIGVHLHDYPSPEGHSFLDLVDNQCRTELPERKLQKE